MVSMTITDLWNCHGIPRGEIKSVCTYRDSGYPSVAEAVKEASTRFASKLAHKGRTEVVYAESLYVQVVSFKESA